MSQTAVPAGSAPAGAPSAGVPEVGPEVAGVAGGSARPGAVRRWLAGDWGLALRHCLLVYGCVRAALFLLGLLSVSLIPAQRSVSVPGWPAPVAGPGWHNAVTAWERADALWFLKIASSGYAESDGSPAFFPMFPMLVHGVGVLTGGRWLLAGFLVSNLALLIGLMVLYRLTAETFDDRTARRTVLYLCLFPTAFFLFSPFSESVFLAFTVGCLYAARHRSWALAGVLGAGAALTRQVGITLCLVLVVEAVHQSLEDRRSGSLRRRSVLVRLLASAGPAAGTAGYLGYWQWRAGDWHVPFSAQSKGWDRDLSFPPQTLLRAAEKGTESIGSYPEGYFTVDLLLVLVALAAAAWVLLRGRPVFGTYVLVSLVFPLMFVFAGRPLMAVPRYLVVVFPLFWALARFSGRWRAHDLVVGMSAAGLSLLGALAVSWLPIF